jgi:hypothetical protein
VKRIFLMLMVAAFLVLALSATAGPGIADPDCTGSPGGRPSACHDSGRPGPANFVGPGGGARQANHH